jgi:hypothetical protein
MGARRFITALSPRDILLSIGSEYGRRTGNGASKLHRSFAWWLPAALVLAGLRMTSRLIRYGNVRRAGLLAAGL